VKKVKINGKNKKRGKWKNEKATDVGIKGLSKFVL